MGHGLSSGTHFKCLALLILLALLHDLHVLAFDFTYGAPTECDSFNVSWSGGRGPYTMLITPLFNPPQNISIPDSAFDEESGTGTFSTQLAVAAGKPFLLTMSDANGFGTGGTSSVLTVGSSISGMSCNTTQPNTDFFFELNSALQQCRIYTFSSYDGAAQPVTIQGLIPLGQIFMLNPPSGETSFNWTANVASGTSIVFIMTDAKGRSGGSSDLKVVGTSDDSSCIDASSPHSTADALATQTNAPHATETVNVSSGPKPGEIAGVVVGGIALMAILTLFVLFCMRRQRQHGKELHSDVEPAGAVFIHRGGASRISRVRGSLIPASRRRTQPSVDLLPSAFHPPITPTNQHYPSASTLPPQSEYEPNPYIIPSDASAADGHSTRQPSQAFGHNSRSTGMYSYGYSRSQSRSDHEAPTNPISTFPNPYSQTHDCRPSVPFSVNSGGNASRKASLAGTTRSTPRFILHTDVDDLSTVDNSDVVEIELPPQYTDRRLRDPSPQSIDQKSDGGTRIPTVRR